MNEQTNTEHLRHYRTAELVKELKSRVELVQTITVDPYESYSISVNGQLVSYDVGPYTILRIVD